jgi:Helix-turn-helix domain of resolvase
MKRTWTIIGVGDVLGSLKWYQALFGQPATLPAHDYFGQLGRKGGRKRQMTDSKIKSAKKLLASGVPPRDVATNLGVSVPTLYRWIPASTQP